MEFTERLAFFPRGMYPSTSWDGSEDRLYWFCAGLHFLHLQVQPHGVLIPDICLVVHKEGFAIARIAFGIASVEKETLTYEAPEGQWITLRLLGHLTENGQKMGYLIEHFECRKPSTEDNPKACLRTLKQRHAYGFTRGNAIRS
jgi:hypothetical protein